MTALATQADVEARLGRDITAEEAARVEQLLEDASANVVRVSTQQFLPVEGDVVVLRRSNNGRVRLPQRPVTAVNAVTDLNGNPLSYVRVGNTNELRLALTAPINAWEMEPYRYGVPAEVLVDYDHGDATVPPLIVGVVCSIVMRALGQSPDQAGIMQESIDGYSYQLGSAAAQGAFGMLPAEEQICASYRRPSSPIAQMA